MWINKKPLNPTSYREGSEKQKDQISTFDKNVIYDFTKITSSKNVLKI
jgi:hypothetical protein